MTGVWGCPAIRRWNYETTLTQTRANRAKCVADKTEVTRWTSSGTSARTSYELILVYRLRAFRTSDPIVVQIAAPWDASIK